MQLWAGQLEDLKQASKIREALIKKELLDKGVILEQERRGTKTYVVDRETKTYEVN